MKNLPDYEEFATNEGRGKAFISDNGGGVSWGGRPIPRYGVWEYGKKGKSKYEVTETGEELEPLLAKHGLTLDDVYAEGPGAMTNRRGETIGG